MTSHDVWECLGIAATADQTLIRQTYAQLIRQYRPDSHPAEFAAIRNAYEEAMRIARTPADLTPREGPTQGPGGWPEAAAPSAPPAPSVAATHQGYYDWNPHAEQAKLRQAMDNQDAVAAIAWLDTHFPQARNGTFDAMQDFENFVVTTLLTHAAPPPSFVEACARQLQWATRWQALAVSFGEEASMRLRGLLHLAVEYRFSKDFAANAWQRHLFADASTRLPKIGWTPLLRQAGYVADGWRKNATKLGFNGYLGFLNPRVLPHLNGDTVQSCDVKNACMMVVYTLLIGYKAPSSPLPLWMLAVLGIAVFFAAAGLRLMWRQARQHFSVERVLGWVAKLGVLLFAMIILGFMAEHELATLRWMDGPALVFRGICLTYFGALLLCGHWWVVRAYDTEASVFRLRKMERADDLWWEAEEGVPDLS